MIYTNWLMTLAKATRLVTQTKATKLVLLAETARLVTLAQSLPKMKAVDLRMRDWATGKSKLNHPPYHARFSSQIPHIY